MGGNAKASSFFRSHNCLITDTQEKYKSRAARVYRERLQQEAAQAIRAKGDQVTIVRILDNFLFLFIVAHICWGR